MQLITALLVYASFVCLASVLLAASIWGLSDARIAYPWTTLNVYYTCLDCFCISAKGGEK